MMFVAKQTELCVYEVQIVTRTTSVITRSQSIFINSIITKSLAKALLV